MHLPKYIHWYYSENLLHLLNILKNISVLSTHYFAIGYHLRTLLSPWKRQYVKVKNMWNIAEWGTALSFNAISRIIGMILRLILIVSGLAVATIVTIFSLIVLAGYLIAIPVFIPYYIFIVSSKKVSAAENLAKKYHTDLGLLTQKILKTAECIFIFEHLGFPPEKVSAFIKTIKEKGDGTKLRTLLLERKKHDPYISYGDLLSILCFIYTPLKNLFEKNEISIHDLEETSLWYRHLVTFPKHQPSLSNTDSLLLRISPLGRDWGYGYTPTLDKLSQDYTEQSPLFPRVVGRDKEIGQMERILSKSSQNSIIMYGEPGVGRHAIIFGLANMLNNGRTKPTLFDKRILLFDPKSVILQESEELGIKKLITDLFSEAENAGNIILVIDGMENYIHTSKGKINFTEEFETFLSNGKLQIIGITETFSYFQFIQPNATLTKLFDTIEVTTPIHSIIMDELKLSIVPVVEYKNNCIITLPALKEALKLADRYVSKNPFPEKAIDLINEVIVYVKDEKHETMILPHHVRELLTVKTKIPVGEIQAREKDLLIHLEDRLHESIINQEEAVSSIAKSLRRARTQVASANRPIGSFLFLGPTGVGKTETAKALSSLYFGSEERMIRYDMSQYQGEGVERLLGSIQTGYPGELLRKINDNPFALLLLDEMEKADKKVLNLFLTLLDEGYVEDIHGRRVDCKNLIVIATSNAAAEYIRQDVIKGVSKDTLTKGVLDYVQKNHIFSPEFLNRFDAVVVFTPLSEGHLREVARLMLKSLNVRLSKHGVSVKITPELIRKLVALGQDPVFGARAIRRTIANTIEDQIAQRIIKGDLKKGEEIEVSL